jgi:hypothetical protein
MPWQATIPRLSRPSHQTVPEAPWDRANANAGAVEQNIAKYFVPASAI